MILQLKKNLPAVALLKSRASMGMVWISWWKHLIANPAPMLVALSACHVVTTFVLLDSNVAVWAWSGDLINQQTRHFINGHCTIEITVIRVTTIKAKLSRATFTCHLLFTRP
jgi:hypothetical protein